MCWQGIFWLEEPTHSFFSEPSGSQGTQSTKRVDLSGHLARVPCRHIRSHFYAKTLYKLLIGPLPSFASLSLFCSHLEANLAGLSDKIKQLEGISNENAEVINQYTLNQLSLSERLNADLQQLRDDQDDKLGHLERRVDGTEKIKEQGSENSDGEMASLGKEEWGLRHNKLL